MTIPDDPVLRRRATIARLVSAGERTGYLLFLAAIVVFVIGFVWDFKPWISTFIIACLIAGSVILAPAIVFGYAVKAADREDRERAQENRQ